MTEDRENRGELIRVEKVIVIIFVKANELVKMASLLLFYYICSHGSVSIISKLKVIWIRVST